MRPVVRTLLLGALLAGAAACGDDPTGAGPPASLNIVSGDQQQGTAGQELAQPLVVRITDDRGKPVRDQLVNFRVISGGGAVFAGSAVTNRDGVAQERWTLGPVAADSQRVEARAVDTETGAALVFAVFRATAVPGAAAAVVPVGPAARQGSAGAVLADSLAVRVTDAGGNPVAGVAVTWTVQSGGGAVAPATATTGADGTARAAWSLGPRLDSAQSVQAAAAGATAATFTATATVPADVVLEKVSGDNQSAFYGATLADSLVVRARLADGRPLWGVSIVWQTSVNAQVSPQIDTTDAQGLAKAIVTLGNSGAGTSASVNGLETRVVFTVLGVSPYRSYRTVTAGQAHACGVVDDGKTYCWGRNASGQLGTGGNQPRDVATQVSTAIEFASLSAGGEHTCGLTAGGAAYCWGSNARGQLGTGSVGGSSDTPAAVAGGHAFASITTGLSHTCGRTTARAVLCWGRNDDGQLGSGHTTDRGTPTAIANVPGGNAFISLSAGDRHTCGMVSDEGSSPSVHRAYCWGSNDAGQLRNFAGARSETPVVVADNPNQPPHSVVAGGSHACTLRNIPSCWGSNSAGQLGSGINIVFATVTGGGEHTCGISGLSVYCWGSNASGQLGNAAGGGGTPVRVTGPSVSEFVQVDAGGAFTCARAGPTGLGGETYAYCWGSDSNGQLGNGAGGGSQTPVRVQ